MVPSARLEAKLFGRNRATGMRPAIQIASTLYRITPQGQTSVDSGLDHGGRRNGGRDFGHYSIKTAKANPLKASSLQTPKKLQPLVSFLRLRHDF
jgi:hypothetical protein